MKRARSAAALLGALLGSCPSGVNPALAPGTQVATPAARAQTEPVAQPGDAADDPAIWVNPVDRRASLVFGTNKLAGLEWYALDGRRLGSTGADLLPNNVDVAYSVRLGDRVTDVVAATCTGSTPGLMLWTLDPAGARIEAALPRPIAVLDAGEPYGMTLYRRARDGALFAFVNDRRGRVEQHRIEGDAGTWSVSRVRAFEVGGQVEGCVADEEFGRFFLSEERRAVWSYDAEPDAPAGPRDRVAVTEVGNPGVVPDIEGLAIYYAERGHGYLIASMQGASTFHVFERAPPHRLLKVIDPRAAGALGDVEETDGIAVESFALAPPFERGLLVAHDGRNGGANQNFKLYAWPDIAGVDLAIDPRRDPRRPQWRR